MSNPSAESMVAEMTRPTYFHQKYEIVILRSTQLIEQILPSTRGLVFHQALHRNGAYCEFEGLRVMLCILAPDGVFEEDDPTMPWVRWEATIGANKGIDQYPVPAFQQALKSYLETRAEELSRLMRLREGEQI